MRVVGTKMSGSVAAVVVAAVVVTAASVLMGGGVAQAAKPPAAPQITRQPVSVTAALGKSVHFSVKATGEPKPTVTWESSVDGGTFTPTGATGDKLDVTATTADGDVAFEAVVSNPSGSVTSLPATLELSASSGDKKVKPLITGFIDKGSGAPYDNNTPFPTTSLAELSGYGSAFAGIVINQSWAQLEPTEGTYDFTPLTDSLAAVAAYNVANPATPLKVKLRIFAGFAAPNWAKSLDGAPIAVAAGTNGASGTLGRFWLSDYETQWTDFQTALAGAEDTNPLISETAVTSCSTSTAEPFIMDANVFDALLAVGWTNADQQQCLSEAMSNYASWHETAIDFTFNTYDDVSPTGSRSADQAFSTSVMQGCADSEVTGALPECIMDNHGLTDTIMSGQAGLYAEMNALYAQFGGHVPVEFQTDSPNGFNLCSAVDIALAQHAQSIELWPPGTGYTGFDAYAPGELTTWNDDVVSGAAPAC